MDCDLSFSKGDVKRIYFSLEWVGCGGIEGLRIVQAVRSIHNDCSYNFIVDGLMVTIEENPDSVGEVDDTAEDGGSDSN